jgi:hypothetical protein
VTICKLFVHGAVTNNLLANCRTRKDITVLLHPLLIVMQAKPLTQEGHCIDRETKANVSTAKYILVNMIVAEENS